MARWWWALLLLSCTLVVAALGKEAVPATDDPALEARMQRIAVELRCLVCQNQTIADSNADLAIDLRKEIREKMQQGASNSEIVDFMVARYGDFVLYRPPLKATTLLLWFGPLLLLAGGAWVLIRLVRRRRPAADAEMTDAQRSRAAELLAGSEAEKR